jgi:hypothetical protein
MTILKNKLSASVRQAKATAQTTPRAAQHVDRALPDAFAAKNQKLRSSPKQAVSTAVKPQLESDGFGFPSRIWPD